jgi:hypothetical protein
MEKMVDRKKALLRLQDLVSKGKEDGVRLLQHLRDNVPTDYKAPHGKINFECVGGDLVLRVEGGGALGVHNNALSQICQKAGLPRRYADILMRDAQADLLAYNLRQRFHRMEPSKRGEIPTFLIREVNGEVRGFLSDRYKRWDSCGIIEAFAGVAGAMRALPVQARAMDTKFFLKVVIDKIFDVGKDLFLFGVCLKHSDFGDGALSLMSYITRLKCNNGMLGDDKFRKIHLGARIDDSVDLSERTYQLDSQTMISAVKDITGAMLREDIVTVKLQKIKEAQEKVIDATEKLQVLRKSSKITKPEEEKISELYRSAEVELLPPGNSVWRLSNAISLFAQDVEPARGLELESLAGSVIGMAA